MNTIIEESFGYDNMSSTILPPGSNFMNARVVMTGKFPLVRL